MERMDLLSVSGCPIWEGVIKRKQKLSLVNKVLEQIPFMIGDCGVVDL